MSGEIMTIRQMAEYLQFSPATVYQLVNKGVLPGKKVGGMWRFKRSDVDEWIMDRNPQASLNILVVEDEKPLCELFVKTLVPKGHTVFTVLSGEEALPLLDTENFDLVFLDLLLPGVSGIDIYKKICQLLRSPEVVVMTSFSSSHLIAKALELGLLTIIQKPFSLQTIFEAVERVVHTKSGTLKSTPNERA